MINLSGKNIVVTGATGGLGSSLVKLLWSYNANLFLISKTREKLLRTALRLKHDNIDKKYFIYNCDFSVLNYQQDLLENILHFCNGNVYGLVNIAAVQEPIGKVWKTDWNNGMDAMNINLFSPMILMRMVLPYMIANGKGKIINLSGGGATNTRPDFSWYATSKTALVRYAEILADEAREYHIDVNCVAPGNMNTHMTDVVLASQEVSEKELENATSTYKQGQEQSKEKALELIEFLLSENSNGITGRLISAQWDDWIQLLEFDPDDREIYKLRRTT